MNKTIKRHTIILLAAVTALFAAIAAPRLTEALTATTTMNLAMTVQGTCSISASSVALPPYASGQPTSNTADGSFSVYCPISQPYSLDIDNGLGYNMGQTPSTRSMKPPSGIPPYISYHISWMDLYTQTVLGYAGMGIPGGTSYIGLMGSGTTQNFKLRITVPGYQTGTTGVTYTDSTVITITY